MDTSQDKDIGMRQSLLGVAGKNTIPPHHIIQQQRRSQSELESQTRKIIPLSHRELCPLCHCPSFIFLQSKYTHKHDMHLHRNMNQLHPAIPGTFTCANCSNDGIQLKLSQIHKLKQEIKQQSATIKPILHEKLTQDNKLKAKQYQHTLSKLRLFIAQKQQENKTLHNKCVTLHTENRQRRHNLQRLRPKLSQKWQYILSEYRQKHKLYLTRHKMNGNICKQISLNKLLQITDFYKMKVLPTMHIKDTNHEQRQLSMIQNIAIPSIFKIKNIKTFYNDPHNELFRCPLPLPLPATQPQAQRRRHSMASKKNKPSSPLQKYISFLTPPYKTQHSETETESKSLPQTLDELVLPPTFLKEDKLFGRGRSHSLDAGDCGAGQLWQHGPHIEHGICAALQYIVSYALHVSKYLNILLLYPMALYKKNRRGKFVIHTHIKRKGKYFRLYWMNTMEKEEFEVGLHLLQENVNHLCVKCGVKSSRLKYLQFIANLNTLVEHLQRQRQRMDSNELQTKSQKIKKKIVRKAKIEPLHIINNYDSNMHLIGEQSASNESRSFSESTAINNSESDVVISPKESDVDSEHEDWDFVDL